MKIDDFKSNADQSKSFIYFITNLIKKTYIELKLANNFDKAIDEIVPIIKDTYYKKGKKIKLDNDFLRILFLENNTQSYFEFKDNKKLEELCDYLDLEDFDYGILDIFGNQNMIDLMINYGIALDPQKIRFKFLNGLNFAGLTINGKFDDTDIMMTNFAGSRGAVINPQDIYLKSLAYTNLKDAVLVDNLDNVLTCCTNFEGAKFISDDDYKEWLKYYNYLSMSEKESYFEELREYGYDYKESRAGKKLVKEIKKQ